MSGGGGMGRGIREMLDHQRLNLRRIPPGQRAKCEPAASAAITGESCGGLLRAVRGQEPAAFQGLDTRDRRTRPPCGRAWEQRRFEPLNLGKLCALALMLPPSVSKSLVPVHLQPVSRSLRDPNERNEQSHYFVIRDFAEQVRQKLHRFQIIRPDFSTSRPRPATGSVGTNPPRHRLGFPSEESTDMRTANRTLGWVSPFRKQMRF